MKIITIKGRKYRALKDGEVIRKDDKFNDGSGPYEDDVGMMRGTENSARIADYAYYRLIQTPAKKAKPWGSFRLKQKGAVKSVRAWAQLNADNEIMLMSIHKRKDQSFYIPVLITPITPKAKKS